MAEGAAATLHQKRERREERKRERKKKVKRGIKREMKLNQSFQEYVVIGHWQSPDPCRPPDL